MDRWRGETFKEYIREELHCSVEGMSNAMKQDFNFSAALVGNTEIWLMSLEPQWLVIISLLQRQHKNKCDSTVTKLLGNEDVDRCLKSPRKGQDGIFF